jgi:hypothetical protein
VTVSVKRCNYGTLQFAEGRWHMSGIEPHVAIRLKQVFLSIDKAVTGSFVFPDSGAIASDLDWFLHRYPMDMAPADRARLDLTRDAFVRRREEIEGILLPDWKPSAPALLKPKMALYDYQAQNAEIARRLGRLVLTDDIGLGKTVSALATVNAPDFLPAAIIAQAHLPFQWRNFTKRFTYMIPHIIEGCTPYSLPPANLYIFRYSNISGWEDIFATGFFKSVVADECQELRNGIKTAKGKAARVLFRHAALKLGLSRTPVINYGDEIFEIIDGFIAPGELGARDDFYREWCRWNGRHYLVKDPDALGTYLREIQLVVGRDGSSEPVNTVTIEVDYDQDIEAKEEDLLQSLAIKVVSGTFTERGQAARELDIHARRITGLAKARHVALYVRVLLEAGVPVILGGWHRSVYEVWLKELAEFNPVMFTGSETPQKKEKAKEAFISGKTNLFIMSLRSGAGLDGLQERCTTPVIGELDWSPKIMEQFIGRVNRPPRKGNEITAIYLFANGGSDPIVMDVCGVKATQSQGIVTPLQGIRTVSTDDSRIRSLAKQFLASRKIAA